MCDQRTCEILSRIPDSWETGDKNGKNIFHIAVEQDHKEVIKFILSRECEEINKLLIRRDKQGTTPYYRMNKLITTCPQRN